MTYKTVDGHETLGDRIDTEEQAFQRNRTEQCRSLRRYEARRGDLRVVERQAHFSNWPDFAPAAGSDDSLGSCWGDPKPLTHRPRDDNQGSSGVHQQLYVFTLSARAGDSAPDVKKAHDNSLPCQEGAFPAQRARHDL